MGPALLLALSASYPLVLSLTMHPERYASRLLGPSEDAVAKSLKLMYFPVFCIFIHYYDSDLPWLKSNAGWAAFH